MPLLRLLSSALVLPALLSGCSTARYYSEAIRGQAQILQRSRPIAVVQNDANTSKPLQSQLALAARLVTFAEQELTLDPGTAYSAYADLGREHVVWNLFAAPELSLEPKKWRYPVVGALEYRGYFNEKSARAAAAALERKGYDTVVGGVDAYSTLGWFRDPLLNTFIEENEIALAELIFHELTHRRLFRKGETAFNEALATAVAQEGVRRWLRATEQGDRLADYEQLLRRRAAFYAHVERARGALGGIYSSPLPRDEMLRRKERLLAALQDDFRKLHRRWGTRGGEHWLGGSLNNAHLVASATYHQHLPVFQSLLTAHRSDWEAFFRAAKSLPALE